MDAELDNRTILAKIIGRMSDAEVQQMLAYADGYEAGRIGLFPSHISKQTQNPGTDHITT